MALPCMITSKRRIKRRRGGRRRGAAAKVVPGAQPNAVRGQQPMVGQTDGGTPGEGRHVAILHPVTRNASGR
jgi:hypothetical protein